MKIEDELTSQLRQPVPEAPEASPLLPAAEEDTLTASSTEASTLTGEEVSGVQTEEIAGESAGPEKKRSRPLYREIIETALIVLVVFFVVRSVIQNYQVDGDSMLPTLHNEEYLLVNKAPYFVYDSNAFARIFNSGAPSDVHYPLGGPSRGDIIVFNAPTEPRDFVKRVIGLPGDTVEIRP